MLALATVAAVTVVRRALPEEVGGVFLLYTAAVMAAAWDGGIGPGIAATAAGVLAGNYFVSGGGSWNLSPAALLTALIFCGVSCVIVWLSHDLRRAAAHVTALQRISDSSLSTLELGALLPELLERVIELLDADIGAILLREGEVLVPVASRSLDEEHAGLRVPIGSGFAGRIAAERTSLIVNGVEAGTFFSPSLKKGSVKAIVGVPLVVNGESRGVLHVGAVRSRAFTKSDAALLQVVADRAALAIENARLFARERQARTEAETASEAKDRFLATVSHELRTPLTVVLGWLWSLRQGNDQQQMKAIDAIERNTQLLARLIEDLLDISRAITGKLQISPASVNLVEIVNRAIDVVRPAMAAKGLVLHKTVAGEIVPVLGDADRLQQVFWNLLSNAVKFTPSGGSIEVTIEHAGVNLVVTVTDSGDGITAAFLPHVFDRFRQQDESSTRRHGGLGLGLAIVKSVVELHGGTVEAANASGGRGARFTVKLPVPAVLNPATDAAVPETVSLAGLRLLVLDDDVDAREAVAAVLECFGADVMTAGAVDDALDQLRTRRADAVLADIAMPGQDGFAFVSRLRAESKSGAMVPAAALTALGTEYRERILAAGFQMYIPKPVVPPLLAAAVRDLASRR